MHGPSRDAGPSRFYSAALTAQARACARLSCCSTRYHCTRSDIATWRARVRTKASAGVCRPRGQPGPLAAPCTTGILKPAELPSRLLAQCNVTTIHNDGRLIPTSSLVRSELLKARLEFAVYIPPCDVAYCNSFNDRCAGTWYRSSHISCSPCLLSPPRSRRHPFSPTRWQRRCQPRQRVRCAASLMPR